MTLDQIIPVLQLSIGPVIVISGAGLVLLLMTNRYGRIIDKAWSLAEIIRKDALDESHRFHKQLYILSQRACRLRLAITFASICTLLAPFLIITLFFVALFELKAIWLIILLFLSCMVSLVIGLLIFLFDVNVSLAALKLETDLTDNNNK